MGIAGIKKLTIIALRNDHEALLETLQKSGAVHLEDVSNSLDALNATGLYNENPHSAIPHLNEQIANLDFSIQFLSEFDKSKGGLFSGKPVYAMREIADKAASPDWHAVTERCRSIEKSLRDTASQVSRSLSERATLEPWLPLDIPFEEAYSSRSCDVTFGTLPTESLSEATEDIANAGLDADIQVVSRNEENASIGLICRKQQVESVSQILKSKGFQELRFREIKGTPAENVKRIDDAIVSLRNKEESLREEARSLVPERLRLMAINDFLNLKRTRNDALQNTKASRTTILLNGWIAERDVDRLIKMLNDKGIICEANISDPEPEDDPPIVFQNKQPARPFEYITKIYGMPQRVELDPTPLFAPFFFIFFGFCLTDAGYGLFVFAIATWALLKFRPRGDGKQFLQILFLGGISTVILGALTGGWFGNAPSMLAEKWPTVFGPIANFLKTVGRFDPMEAKSNNAILLMLIALSLGIIQVLFGYIVGFINNIKAGSLSSALMDKGSMLLLLIGVLSLVVSGMGVMPSFVGTVGMGLAAFGTLTIIVFGGRSSPSLGFKIFNGFFSAYNAWAGFLSDVLSYSRLWGLGLVTGVMATTVNIIAKEMGKLLWQIPIAGPVIGILIGLIIIVFGHLFSIAINVLGALIHSTRLQFVEFFSKFYSGGARGFEPFAIKTRYVSLKD